VLNANAPAAGVLKAHVPTASVLKATALATLGSIAFTSIAMAASFPPLPGHPPAPPGEDPRSPQPDIVAFVLDDIPPLDGRLWKLLPNIRRTFVQQGTQFVDAHVESPTCTPGRAGLLTGLHTHHHGAYQTDGSLFDPGETIATELQAEGYHTITVGKYLNLFDRFTDKLPPGWDEFHGYGGGYYDYNLYSNGTLRRYGSRPRDYSGDVIRRITKRTLSRAPKDAPLFAWITPYAMHKPWSVAPRDRKAKGCTPKPWKPQGYMEKNVRDKPAYVQQRKLKSLGGYSLRRICKGMLSVDDLVGEVVDKLDRLDRLENTLLILTSDNGMSYGSQRILHDKKAPYGTQVPLFMRWPRVLGVVPKTVRERVQNIDLAPTMCDIAGCRLGPYPTGQTQADGVSLLRLLTGERERLGRRSVLTSYQEQGHRVPRYWSVSTTAASPLASKVCAQARRGGCRWVYTEYETGEVELYDVSNGPCHAWKRSQRGDPCMIRNQAGKKRFAAVQRALRAELARRSPAVG
jgi:arylsulfatase A-like enzyme